MKSFAAATALAALVVSLAPAAADTRLQKMLRQLDPGARMEQVCDMAAMARIRQDEREYKPDRTIAAALAEPKVADLSLEARGAAFRSGGKWFQLSYVCRTTADRMQVVQFDYKIGAAIPEDKWDSYGLPR
jgi:hypothetical protein